MRYLGSRVDEWQIQYNYCLEPVCDRVTSVCDWECEHNHIEIEERKRNRLQM
jgi:hypothetical protein